MCGIAGIFSFTGQSIEENTINKMTEALVHRGPDGQGTFVEGPVALGHRRLSIIDLESGGQPMQSVSGNSVISYNGEIYNFPDLRANLLKEGYLFKTKCDTEVILTLYEKYGVDCLQHLSGMFAFALWDRKRQRLFLARDRVGIKPLYICTQPDRLIFSSEIKAIRKAAPHFNELDPQSVNSYFTRQYVGGAGTIFKEIKKVLPGTYLEVDSAGVKEKIYWQPAPNCDNEITLPEAVTQLDHLMQQSVTEHLVSDVPVGLFLSGGIDSGTLLSYVVNNSAQQVQTFSVGFGEESKLSETKFARLLANNYETNHREIQVTYEEVLNSLPFILKNLDQPFADYAALPTFIMSKFAAEHVKVVLSGEGADELFGGYNRYRLFALFDAFDKMPINGFLSRWRLPKPCLFNDSQRSRLFKKEFIRQSSLEAEVKMMADKNKFSKAGHVNSALFLDVKNWLVDDLLMKVDKMGMLASLEARVPYLDHQLIEFMFALKGSLKVGIKSIKILLKKLAQPKLPREIYNRPKHGFTIPVNDWFRGPLKHHFQETIVGELDSSEWLNRSFVETLFTEHLNGKNYGLKLWSVLIFNNWLRELLP